ncbi:MAG: urocanate hydratase, partial [Bacteroidetes bacterium]|nr:urocanate hydratase [Bacteroidota bacterium]
MNKKEFKKAILAGIPDQLPEPLPWDDTVSHAPVRKDILNTEEKRLALRNALRYFEPKHHEVLAPEFARELK